MAIQLDLSTSQYGVPFAATYFRVVTAAISRQRRDRPIDADIRLSKFDLMLDIAGYATAAPGDDTREIDFRRYHAPLEEVEAQPGATFLDRCYAWIMAQPDMAGSTPA